MTPSTIFIISEYQLVPPTLLGIPTGSYVGDSVSNIFLPATQDPLQQGQTVQACWIADHSRQHCGKKPCFTAQSHYSVNQQHAMGNQTTKRDKRQCRNTAPLKKWPRCEFSVRASGHIPQLSLAQVDTGCESQVGNDRGKS